MNYIYRLYMLFQLFERSAEFIEKKLEKNQQLELKKYILVYSDDINEFQSSVKRIKKADPGLKEITKVTLSKPNVVKSSEIEFLPCTDKDKINLMKS